jgi:hypothetical protein
VGDGGREHCDVSKHTHGPLEPLGLVNGADDHRVWAVVRIILRLLPIGRAYDATVSAFHWEEPNRSPGCSISSNSDASFGFVWIVCFQNLMRKDDIH